LNFIIKKNEKYYFRNFMFEKINLVTNANLAFQFSQFLKIVF
jgi:hypothetical protein